ncbi:peptidylprolyl isomerase [Prosthecobacter sp.]|uniref:peptidylprolyl isomerase n=1 Tax=Prosthecobacter sp. TaxID=1965333 RepID=UPI00378378EF
MAFVSSPLRDLRVLLATSCLLLFTAAAHAFVPNAPAALGAAVQDSQSIVYFSFDDNSTNETGFDFAYTANGGSTQHLQVLSGNTNQTTATTAGTGNVIVGLLLTQGVTYTFQVASYAGSATAGNMSTTTNSITVIPASFSTPAIATMTNTNETTVRFAVVDNSYSEAGYFYEYSTSGTFASGGNTGASVSNVSFPGLAPGTAYQFRIRGFQGTSTSPTAYTTYSNTYSISTPFTAPTAFTATVQNDSTVAFTWADNSSAETGYEIQYSIAGANNFKKLGSASANATSITLGGFGPGQSSLSPNQSYDFKVRAIYNDGATVSSSAFSAVVTKSTKDGFTSATYKQIPYNQAFTYQAVVTTAAARSTWNITNLPAGLSFNSSTGQITGTPTATGVTNCPMTASFVGGATASTTLTLRVVLPPTVATAITAQSVSTGGNASIPLSDKFTDPDTTSAARLVTSQGTMDFILYDTATTTQNATPLTVANFLSYIRNFGVSDTTNKYDGAVFHRSIPGFIVQGGAFKVQSSPNNFSSIVTAPSPNNEPVNSNTRGTVAMAKLGSDPNSATDQFFVNLADNSGNLDSQNGGFTAFARVAGNGLAVAEAIAALPMVDSLVNVGGSPTTTLTDWPLSSSSAAMDTTKVVSITSATKNVPLMTYAITGNTNSSAVTASINTVVDGSGNSSSTLQITGAANGQSNVTVTATDLDGNTVSQTFAVTVAQGPTVTTPTSASITATTATLGGNVTSDGGSTITERGVVVSITSVNNSPTIGGTGVAKFVGTGTTGVFTTSATGLSPVTGYSFKAYATNSIGTTYTSVSTFTTNAQVPTVTTPTYASITATTATLGGNVTSDGGAAITERGVVYSVTTTNSDPIINGPGVVKFPVSGTTGVFTANVSSLAPGTGYSFKAYAINSVGTTYTSPAETFTTSTQAPTVIAASSASITATTATLGGNVTSDGGTAITERGVVYSITTTNGDPIINGAGVFKVTATGTTGVFTAPVTSLSAGTGYSFKAYAINSIGTTYTSPVSTFTTSTQSPTVTTPTSASLTATTVTLGGNVTSDGGAAITERGVVYSVTTTNGDPIISGVGVAKVVATGTTGVFTAPVTNLSPGTGYSFKAYATNNTGTTYSTPVSTFTTLSSLQNWRQTYFGTTANSGDTADNADYDKDGIPNLVEYALNLNPTTSSKLNYTAAVNGANFEYTYSRSTAAVNAGLVINVEWSTTFASGSWSTTGVTQNVLSDDGTTQQVKAVIPTNSATAKFVRISVSPPP